ncbi:tail spike protein [Acinetobacter phage Fri1]|uniref:Tail spike protein n=1 Tax=Acinetobacter phage Fri1 TaxID=1647373 RepID=A0A0H4TJ34_9CAUD|nr:tail spike protein [Acinetobacter phage Fri1]AKQ06854.1 tail spike protein [Acinetobacter phage Fri1]
MNILRSFTETVVTTPTDTFPISFEYDEKYDAVHVFLNDVAVEDLGYTVSQVNAVTLKIEPAIPEGTVRIERETDIDKMKYIFDAGALFIDQNVDADFKQIVHSQQEVRDGFIKLRGDVLPLVHGLQEALKQAQEASEAAQDAADAATEAARTTKYYLKYFEEGTPYPKFGRIMLSDGTVVISLEDENSTDPNIDMTKWVKSTDSVQVDSVNALRKVKGLFHNQKATTTSYVAGTGFGGATYLWDANNTATDDGLSVIRVTGAATGAWLLQVHNKVLHATQAGLRAELLESDLIDQTTILQKCVDYMALIGGGVVQLPKGHIYAKAMAKSNVEVRGTFDSFVSVGSEADINNLRTVVQTATYKHGTFWHSSDGSQVYLVPENVTGAGVSNLKMLGSRLGSTSSNCGFGIKIIGDSFTAKWVDTSGFRLEGLYIRGKDGVSCSNHYFENCNFLDARRNTAALVYCHDVTFKNCTFQQLKPELTWVYLFDIEPNPATTDTVYNVTLINCVFNALASAGAEPTVLVKEQNTPTGSPNVKFLNCRFKGKATIRNNCANGWKDCIVDNCEFDTLAFSTTTTGYVITSGRFTNNTLWGKDLKGFSYNTLVTGDFLIEGNRFQDTTFENNIVATQASFGVNTFLGTATVIQPVDRRTITQQYRNLPDISGVKSPINDAYFNTEIRNFNLDLNFKEVLTVPLRSGCKITITGADATTNAGSKAYVELFVNSDNSTTITAHNEVINDPLYGVKYSWSGRTLSLAGITLSANTFIVKVDVFSALPQYSKVTWLI